MTVAKIKQYSTKKKYVTNIVWSSRKFYQDAKENNPTHSAAKKLKLDRKRVREWVQKEEKVKSIKGKRFRLDGGVRKLTDVELEEEVLSWIQQRRSNMLRVSTYFK